MALLDEYDELVLRKISSFFEGTQEKNLGTELFEFCSSLVPSVNVDVLLVNPLGEFLMTWRDDRYYGPGWHIPGGVIRHKETIPNRIRAVMQLECGLNERICTPIQPDLVQEIFSEDRCVRGHFVSLLYTIRIAEETVLNLKLSAERKFFSKIPDNFITQHQKLYKSYLHENFCS